MELQADFLLPILERWKPDYPHEYFKGIRHAIDGWYGYIDAWVAYCMVRELKPDIVWEVGPHFGYTTTILLQALKDNKKGYLRTFEAQHAWADRTFETVKHYAPDMAPQLRVIAGDIRDAWDMHEKEVDLLFMDAGHEYDLAKWYTETLVPLIKKDGWLHAHDVWTLQDEHPHIGEFSDPSKKTERTALKEMLDKGGYDYFLTQRLRHATRQVDTRQDFGEDWVCSIWVQKK